MWDVGKVFGWINRLFPSCCCWRRQWKLIHRMTQNFFKISLQLKKRNHICNFLVLIFVYSDIKNYFPCPYKLISLPTKSFKGNFKFFEPVFIRKTFLHTLTLHISERLLYVFPYFIQYRKNLFKRDLRNIYFFENLIDLLLWFLRNIQKCTNSRATEIIGQFYLQTRTLGFKALRTWFLSFTCVYASSDVSR